MEQPSVYLDNAATTQVRPEVVQKMQEVLALTYGNPSSTHSFGRSAKTLLETARKSIAKTLNAKPAEIIFTSGGTEADNMILRCAVRDLGIQTILTTKIEHHAVLHTVEELAIQGHLSLKFVKVDTYGNPDISHIRQLLTEDDTKKLVSLMHINNEVGTKLDIDQISELCQKHNALLHSDTVQSVGHYEWDLEHTPVDFLTAAAHKFHGPKGVGFAFIRKNSGLKAYISGGAQERGFRAGTESLHNIIGMEQALTMAYANLEGERNYVAGLKRHFLDQLKEEIPEVRFNGHSGSMESSTYTLVNVRLPITQQKGLMLLFHLDMKGIACSKGSACQSGSATGSHVLAELLDPDALALPSLRFSFSIYNNKKELDYVVRTLKEFVES